jgi:uncharacterized protein GlcG (DUF336 family)
MSDITLGQATGIVEAALAKARAMASKPMAVVVVDASGQLKAAAREDGASLFRFDIAQAKAWAAVGMGMSTRKLAERARDNPNFFVSLAAVAQGRFVAQTGAVVIQDAQGNVLGAAGASGGSGDEDEWICMAGVEAVRLMAA